MAFQLVGSVGTPVTVGAGQTASPQWGAGSDRTASNLLILWAESYGATPTPNGWTRAAGDDAIVFYRIAAGGDAAPTISNPAYPLSAMLAEFGGRVAAGA